jgi:hypothetical protein
MSNIDHSKLAEMLRLARASLNEEFLKKQSEAYQQWYVSSNQTWKTTGTLLPPASVKLVYPTEQDIVQRALEIYNTLTPPLTVVQSAPTITEAQDAEIIEEPMAEAPIEVISEPVEAIEEPVVEVSVEAIEEPIIEVPVEVVEEPVVEESKFKSLLTKWGGKGSF